MTARAEADPAHPAGHALIRVAGAAAASGTPGFRMQRDAGWGEDRLGPGGWQSSDVLLQPDAAEASGSDLVLHVGWNVCQHLEAGVYELSVPGAGLAQVGLSWPDIVPQHGGISRSLDPPVEQPVIAVRTLPSSPTLAPASIPVASIASVKTLPGLPKSEPRSPISAIVSASFVLLLILGAGADYWLNRGPDRTALAETPPAASPAPDVLPAPAASSAVELGGLSVPDVLARAPNPAAISVEGERRLRSDRRDDGLLLLEAAADRADPTAAATLARLYDPVLFQPGGPIPRPDPRQAARYYRDAVHGGADVATAREALRQNLQARVQAGDLGANLSLKDFWP
jgi:hypothetical protein